MTQQTKKELRAHYRSVREHISAAQREQESLAICEQILQSELYAASDSVLLYAALGEEIDLGALARDAWEQGKTVAYPRCLDREGHMDFFVVDSPERLVKGSFSILEPDAECPRWQPTVRAVCIVPALAVDQSGHRLGYGKGYYDRFLSDFQGISVCAVYGACQAEQLPRDGHDLPVQYIVNAREVWHVDEQKLEQNSEEELDEQLIEELDGKAEPLTIDDMDFAAEPVFGTEDEDYGAEQDTAEQEMSAEDDVPNLKWQNFIYRWKKIPLLGMLPMDPVTILVLSSFVLLLLSRLIDVLFLDRDNEYFVVVLLQIMIFIIPGYLYFRLRGKGFAKRMRLAPPKPDHIFVMVFATGALITGCFLLSALMGNLTGGASFVLYDTFVSKNDGTMAGIAYLVLAYAILPAVCEELIFRSMLCAEFEGRGVACALTVSTVLFSMLHFNPLQMPVYLFAGLILALTLYATRSVFCCVIVHFLYNLFCLFGQGSFADFYVTHSAKTLFMILMIAAFLLCIAVFCGECGRLYRGYAKEDGAEQHVPVTLGAKQVARNIGLAFASPAAILCVVLFLMVSILR